jgi:hypothetical protein
MDPIGDLADYVVGLDWLGGLAVAAAAIGVGAVIVVVIERSAHGPGERWGDMAAAALARWRAARDQGPEAPWRCDRCGSVNPAGALSCYRGCGPRVEVATAVSSVPDEEAAPAQQRGGRTRRRG